MFGPPSAALDGDGASRSRLWLAVLLLALTVLTILVFAPVRHFDFVSIDDHVYVQDNPFVRSGVTWARVTDVFVSTYANFWHPLTILSLMADVALFGANPGALHVSNLVFHLLSTLLLFLVLRRMTRSDALSAFVAALFAVHPLHVESVAWISQRKDVLSTVFWMLTLLAYERFARAPGWRRYGLVAACFALGLMAKPMLVTLPPVLLLLDVWPLRRVSLARDPARPGGWPVLSRIWGRLVIEKLPLVGLSVAASLLAVAAQERGGALAGVGGFTLDARLANAPIACVTYMGRMVWPSGLSVFYPYAQTPAFGAATVATVLLLAVSILVVRLAATRPYLIVGWFWYLGTWLPVSGLVQVGSHAMADRYTYVPLIGLFVAVAWGIADWAGVLPGVEGGSRDASAAQRGRSRGARLSLAVVGVAVVVVCAVVARAQVMTWENSVALWRHALAVMPDNYYAWNAYGLELQKQGRLGEAASHFLKSSALAPGFPNADGNLGLLLAEAGRSTEAIAEYREALRRAPDYQPAHANLGTVLIQEGRVDEAITHCREAVRLSPEMASAHANLANALAAAGLRDEALLEYEEAVRLDPASASTRYNMANTLRQMGRLEEAVRLYKETEQLAPADPDVHVGLSEALRRGGLVDEAAAELQAAVREYREAEELTPLDPDVHGSLGEALGQQGLIDEAVAELKTAIELTRNPAPRRISLGNLLLGIGRTADALEQFRLAVSAAPDDARAHMGLGTALFRAGRLREAAAEHQAAVRLAPGVADTHYNLAVTLTAMGQLRDAADQYEKTLQLEGGSADVDLALAMLLEQLGQWRDAATRYSDALRLQPDLAAAKEGLARVQRRGR